MILVEYLYWLVGAFLIAAAWINLRERRWVMAAFWLILSGPFVFGEAIAAAAAHGNDVPARIMGTGVVALGLLAAFAKLGLRAEPAGDKERREQDATRLGNRLFLPALAIPLITLVFYVEARYVSWDGHHLLSWNGIALLDPKALTLTSLGLASIIAMLAAMRVTRARPVQAILEGRRLLDSLGWAVLLPMILATLGGVFAATGVGETIAALTSAIIPIDNRMACLLAFAFGMVMFTIIMGNAFAAFPVMMAGIGLPLLIVQHGASPAILGALGMLTGYCGTLLTPMAANFNIVPAVLLELPDQYGVIRSQIPTALALMLVNVLLMALLVFR